MKTDEQFVNLLISHSQVLVRARTYSESDSQWGPVNLDQGAIIHDDYVIFDPLPDDTFGANVELRICDDFVLDGRAQRCILVPFIISIGRRVEVASATESVKLNMDFKKSRYALYYEICEGNEVFYKFTFVPNDGSVEPKYLLDDPWGGEKGVTLVRGIA